MFGYFVFSSMIGVALLFGWIALRTDRVSDSIEPQASIPVVPLAFSSPIGVATAAAAIAQQDDSHE